MTNFNKDTLIKKFISNKNIITPKFLGDRKIFDYIIEDTLFIKTGTELMKDLVNSFIKETFYLDKTINNKKDFLNLVINYDLKEYIDGLVDKDEENLINSYIYFKNYIDTSEGKLNIIENLKRAQFEGYNKFYEEIRKEFIKYLKVIKN